MDKLTENMIAILRTDLNVLQQELHDTQKEISHVLGEMQVVSQGLTKLVTAGIRSLDERLSTLENNKLPSLDSYSEEQSDVEK